MEQKADGFATFMLICWTVIAGSYGGTWVYAYWTNTIPETKKIEITKEFHCNDR